MASPDVSLHDRYRPLRLLGEGGSGRVWLAEDRHQSGTRVAVKELSGGASGAARDGELRREFATLACLRHPNLIEVHEFDVSETGVPRFSMEYIEGGDLIAATRGEGADRLIELAVEGLRALAFLHDFDLLHRDLKPANLLVRDRPRLGCRLVLVDFGLALWEAGPDAERLAAQGTLPYLAPELFRNAPASRRTDLYGLGAVLYEAIHGRTPFPFDGKDLTGFITAATEGRYERLPLPAGYPIGLGRWLDDLIAVDPMGRPATAAEALARLNEACGTDTPLDTPVNRAARLMSGPPAERESELAAIWAHLAEESDSRVVLLTGGPGTGKSALLRWLEVDAVRRGWPVLSQQQALGGSPLLPDTDGPALTLLDGLETAGMTTVDRLDRLVRSVDAPAVRVVAALRPDAVRQPRLARLIEDAATVPTLARVELAPLRAAGVRAMARRAMGGEVSDRRVGWLLERSEGSPAIVESLLIEGGWERGDLWLPATGRLGFCTGRLSMLSAEGRAWLDALSVLDGGSADPQIATVAGLDAATAEAASHQVAAAGLARRRHGFWSTESGLLAEVLRGELSDERREEFNSRAAATLAADPQSDPWILARIWASLDQHAWAARSAEQAAARALEAGDPAEAAVRFGRALASVGRDRVRRRELRAEQAAALMAAGLHAAAARAYGAVAALTRDENERRSARVDQAHALVQAGRFDRALVVSQAAAAAARQAGDAGLQARAEKVAGIVLGRLGREEEAIPLLDSALELLRRAEERGGCAELLQLLGTCKLRLGLDEAAGDFAAAIDAEPRPGSPQQLKSAVGLAVIKARQRRYDEAAQLLERVRTTADEQGMLDLQESALSKLAAVAIDREHLDRGIALAEQAADLAQYLGDRNLVLVNRCRLADALIRCGRAGQAVALLRETLAEPLDRVEPENVDYANMLLADAWMESGHADEQRVQSLLTDTLIRCRKREKKRALLMALTIEMERRARPDCADPFGPVRREFEQIVGGTEDEIDVEIRIRCALAHARWELWRGDAEAASQAAGRADRLAEQVGAEGYRVRAHAVLAEALRRTGRETEAAGLEAFARELLACVAGRLQDEGVRADYLARSVFTGSRRSEQRDQARLGALYDMIRVLNSATDPDELLESILDMALRAVDAQRGMILLAAEGAGPDVLDFSVHLVRNLEDETVRDAEAYSRRIVAAAGAGQSVMAHDTGSDDRFNSLQSVSLYGIRSLMCVPLRSRGRITGTVYLDSREGTRLFTSGDLRFLEAFADHAALALQNTHARAELERKNQRLQTAAETRTEFANIVGRAPAMQVVFERIEQVKDSDLAVLIQGESGTGKELVARAIHFQGARRQRMFVSENCAAIPESLLESELFGHVRGAFTGAERDRAGLFEQADGGTLFLDEVGDMSPGMQARLLRAIQEGEIRRVGGDRVAHVDVRVVAATHRELAAEVAAGRFREDLFYRLQVLSIELPPLRERAGDVSLLVGHFLERVAEQRNRPRSPIDNDLLGLLERYTWPGNVRQLENTLHRLVLLAGNGPLSVALMQGDAGLRDQLLPEAGLAEPMYSLKISEKEQIRRALAACQGSRTRAARLLGVSRATLYRKLKQHSL